MYSFYREIALPLASRARAWFGWEDNGIDTIFSADRILTGSYAEAMVTLLRLRRGFRETSSVTQWIDQCRPYFGVPGAEIDSTVARLLYLRFIALYDED